MIDRYSRPIMQELWSLENKYRTWLEVELAVCEAWAKRGRISKEDLAIIKEKASFSVERIDEIERDIHHDVIAFLTNVAENVGPSSRYIHMGLTSSDILDTSFALLLKRASDIIMDDIDKLLSILKEKAYEYRELPMIGRSHGVHAEPITLGLKFTLWYQEMERNRGRLEAAIEDISYGKISGAVGTYAHMDPEIEEDVCNILGLRPAPISTQIIQRDRHAHYFSVLAVLAGSIEKIALEIRHLQRTEVLEAEEPFGSAQKGSSAMPHKRNPILSENLCGLARLIRSYAQAAFENIALWHERDISHSSVERVIAPDATILIDFMLNRLIRLLSGLLIYPDKIRENLWLTKGLIFSQQVLLALAEKGLSREDAYRLVQKRAMECWQTKKEFKSLLLEDDEIMKYLTEKEINDIFRIEPYLRHVGRIYERVFKE